MIPECPTVDEAVEAAVGAIRPRHYEIWDYHRHDGVTRFQVLHLDQWDVIADNFRMSHVSWQANFRAGKLRFVV